MSENRKFYVYGLFIIVAAIYLVRLLYIQVLDNTYETASNSIKAVTDMPMRGQIYDRNGKLIVYNTLVYDIFVTPSKVKIADTLAFCKLLNISRGYFDSTMVAAKAYSRKRPSLFMHQLSKEDFARIQDAMIDYPGFEYHKSSTRTYTAPTMAHALGYVSEITKKQLANQEIPYYKQGDLIGQSGLEKFYEEQLRGQRGVRYIMQDVHGVDKGPWKDGELDTIALAGKNLYSSIDLDLQVYADSLMAHKAGAVFAIEPSTGEVLVATSAPTYDPALFATRDFSKNYSVLVQNPYKPLLNRAIMGNYRPGSTFKTLQALIALEEGAIAENSVFTHAGAPLNCHCGGKGAYGIRNAIRYSCNPYFFHTFRRVLGTNNETNPFKSAPIGLKRWHDFASSFGFGKKLGIDLPSEAKGNLPDIAFYDRVYGKGGWKFSTIYSIGIGEGELLITPLKLANLAATIANRGWYITPHLIKGIEKKNNPLKEYTEKHIINIDKKYFEAVIDGMEGAVAGGTVTRGANIPGIVMVGKTGTSENKLGEDHSLFIGFAPKYNPKIAIAVFVENAKWGGIAAASVASLIIEKYIKGYVERKAFENEWKQRDYLKNVIIRKDKPTDKTPPKEEKKTDRAEPIIVNKVARKSKTIVTL